MMHRKILNALLIASFGAVAATASAQTSAPQQNDTPRNAPTGATTAPATGTTSGATSNGSMGSSNSMSAPGSAMDSSAPRDMSGYKAARAACDTGPATSKEQCRNQLNARYSAVAPKCQKLSGNALDDCLKGADTAQ